MEAIYLVVMRFGLSHLMLWRRRDLPKYLLAEVEGVAAEEVDITTSHVLFVLRHCTQQISLAFKLNEGATVSTTGRSCTMDQLGAQGEEDSQYHG